MKKKLFSLLMLLLALCSGAWAQTPFNFVKDGALNFTPGTAITSVTGLQITPSANADESSDNGKWAVNGTVKFAYKDEEITLGKTKYKTAPTVSSNTPTAGSYVKIEALENGTVDLLYYVNSSSTKTMNISHSGSVIKSEESSKTAQVLNFDVVAGETYYAYVNSNACEYAAIYFTSTASSPTITADDAASITATTSGVNATQDISITGANLTASGTLTATLSPAVDGLSVGLSTNAISASGAIETTATLTYNRTVNVKQGTTTLTISDGTTSKNITVTYSAKVVDWTLQSISESTTWTFNDANITSGTKEGGATTETVYANIDGMTFGADFDAVSLAVQGNYPYYSPGQIAQAKLLKFNTTVPGTVTVTWYSPNSDTKYIAVNDGSNGSTNNTAATTDAVAVEAGAVTIKGYNDEEHTSESLLNIKSVVFTATPWTLTYDGNGNDGGAVPAEATLYADGATPTILDNTGSLTNGSLTFSGWNTEADGSGTAYAAGSTLAAMTADVTLYAQWEEEPIVTLPTSSKAGYTSSIEKTNITRNTAALYKKDVYEISTSATLTLTVPSTTNVTKIKVEGTAGDSSTSTVTITGANNSDKATETFEQRDGSIKSIEFVPKNQTTTYTITCTNKKCWVIISIYGTEHEAVTTALAAGDRTYATHIAANDLDFTSVSSDVTAYIATGLNDAGTAVIIEPVSQVPANAPILVKTATEGATVNVPLATSTPDALTTNLFVEGDGKEINTATDTDTYYYLANNLFHKATSGTLQSGKAYLKLEGVAPASAHALTIGFDDEATGIQTVGNEVKGLLDGVFYNIAGQRVAMPKKGLYIVNGKKVLVK